MTDLTKTSSWNFEFLKEEIARIERVCEDTNQLQRQPIGKEAKLCENIESLRKHLDHLAQVLRDVDQLYDRLESSVDKLMKLV